MAAGLIVVAHNSGGPKTDIVEPGRTGFLASTVNEYAAKICQVFEMSADDRDLMQRRAIESAKRFSDEAFSQAVQDVVLTMKI